MTQKHTREKQRCVCGAYRHRICRDCGVGNLTFTAFPSELVDHMTRLRHVCATTKTESTFAQQDREYQTAKQEQEQEATQEQETQTQESESESEQEVPPIADQLAEAIYTAIKPRLDHEFETRGNSNGQSAAATALRITFPERKEIVIPDSVHPMFPRLLECMQARVPTWLYGPAGSGKTSVAPMLASLLCPEHEPSDRLAILSLGPATQFHDIVGYADAGGNLVPGPMQRPFTNGGLMVFDEVDNGSAEAITPLNTPIGNRLCNFPVVGMVHAHPDFYCIATANTYGQGADAVYIARVQQDGAFMNRFAYIPWGYDEALEQRILNTYCGQYPTAAAGMRQYFDTTMRIRAACENLSLRIVVASTRDISYGLSLMGTAAASCENVLNMLVWWKLGADDTAKLKGAIA